MSKTTAKRPDPTPLDEARAAVVLARISPAGTPLGERWYERLRADGVTKADADRALNLLAARGRIRFAADTWQVAAFQVLEDAE